MLWRVHPQTVNLVPPGKHSRFDSVDTHQERAVSSTASPTRTMRSRMMTYGWYTSNRKCVGNTKAVPVGERVEGA